MTKINLLPWREKLQEERTHQFYVGLGFAVLIAILFMISVHAMMAWRISNQFNRNEFLIAEIKVLDKKVSQIKSLEKVKSALLSRMGIIQELQTDRTLVVHMFDEIVTILPKGVHLTEIQRKGSTVILSGKTESNSNVSDLMKNINKSRWLSNPVLQEIKAVSEDNSRMSEFSLNLVLVNPYENKEMSHNDLKAKS